MVAYLAESALELARTASRTAVVTASELVAQRPPFSSFRSIVSESRAAESGASRPPACVLQKRSSRGLGGRISVLLKRSNGTLELLKRSNGPLEPPMPRQDSMTSRGLALRLSLQAVASLARRARGL